MLQNIYVFISSRRRQQATPPFSAGSLIVNNRGVPGTLGCIAYSNHFNSYVFLTNYHVLFGKDAQMNEDVWAAKYDTTQQNFHLIGQSLSGKIGVVQNGDLPTFIDCALGTFSNETINRRDYIKGNGEIIIQAPAEAKIGESVRKLGSATKLTSGIIADIHHHDVCNINGTIFQACNQILIAPAGAEKFSDRGDSGSVILNDKNEIVGLLWSTNAKGEGIACPILPVMQQLNIRFRGHPQKKKWYYFWK